jgi:hypothetical protein
MHMQDGIGRGGYRVLAIVFCGVGALGLLLAAVALSPRGLFDWIGLVLAAVALVTLTGLMLTTLGPRPLGRVPGSDEPAGVPTGGVAVPLPTPEPPAAVDPSADLGFEYGDAQPPASAQAGGEPALGSLYHHSPPPAEAAVPPARPARAAAPPARKAGKADSGWPERKGKAGVTNRQVAERDQPREPREAGPDFEADGPKPARREAPILMARTVASAEATGIPEGTGVGKCGNCGVLLLAPKKRPIRLQCPRCERVHTLA